MTREELIKLTEAAKNVEIAPLEIYIIDTNALCNGIGESVKPWCSGGRIAHKPMPA